MIKYLLSLLLAAALYVTSVANAQQQQPAAAAQDTQFTQLAIKLSKTKSDEERRSLIDKNKSLLTPGLVKQLNHLGAMYVQQGEPDHAAASHQAGLMAAQELGDKNLIAAVYNNLGLLYEVQTNFPEATRYYEQTVGLAKEVGNKGREALGLTGLANVDRHEGRYTVALGRLEEAVKLAHESNDGDVIANVLQSLGALHRSRGDLLQALNYAQQSVDIDRKHNPHQVASSLSNLGEVYTLLGDYQRALDVLTQAFGATDPNNPLHIQYRGQAMNDTAIVHYKQGDYARALDLMGQVLNIAKEIKSPNAIADVSSQMAEVYIAQGDFAQAFAMYKEALAIADQMNVVELQMKINNSFGEAYLLQGNFSSAEGSANRALDLARQSGSKPEEWNALIIIANTFREKRDYAGALQKYQECLRIAEEIKSQPMIARTLTEMGALALNNGHFQKALDMSNRAAATARSIGMHDTLWRALTYTGRAYIGLKQLDAASKLLTEAIEVVENLNRQVAGSDETRHRFFENKVEPYYEMVNLFLSRGDKWLALHYAERTKARVLGDLIANGRSNLHKAMTQEEIERERVINYQLVSLNNQIKQQRLAPQSDDEIFNQLRDKLERARLDYESFQSMLYAKRPQLRLQRARITALTQSDVSAMLDDTTALVEYLYTPTQIHIFVLTKRKDLPSEPGPQHVNLNVYSAPIDGGKLSATIKDFRKLVGERGLNFKASAAELYDVLIKPIASHLPENAILCIVPDGPLWELPFQALLKNKDRYLLEDHALFYTPSLSILNLMRLRSIEQERGGTNAGAPPNAKEGRVSNLFAVGNPQVGAPVLSQVKSVRGDLKLGDLPDAEKEVAALGALFGKANSRVFIGTKAVEEVVKKESPNFDVLHFATHGVLDNKSPMYSWLLLANSPRSTSEDGLMEAWEVANLNLKADLVTLSACETALGIVSAGEGMMGMSWAFFAAGSSSLIASQWEVNSPSTSTLMIKTYRHLMEGSALANNPAAKARALQQAALSLRRTEEYELPYYWAGFILVGDPN